jgi:hypothetical protein
MIANDDDQRATEPGLVPQGFDQFADHVIGVPHRVVDGVLGALGLVDRELRFAAPERIVIADGRHRSEERPGPTAQLADPLGSPSKDHAVRIV